MIKLYSKLFFCFCCFSFLWTSCSSPKSSNANQETYVLQSPNNKLELCFNLNKHGVPAYNIEISGQKAIHNSSLGLKIKNTQTNKRYAPLTKNMKVLSTSRRSVDETWQPVWGTKSEIKNQYNELTIRLQSKGEKAVRMNIVFRVFNDGVGFRYIFPEQPSVSYFTVLEEETQFRLAKDYKAFWIPGDYDSNEFVPNETMLSEIDANNPNYTQEIHAMTPYHKHAVQTPLLITSKTNSDKLYINIHEAALLNYPAMQLVLDKKTYTLQSHLVPNAVGEKALLETPAKSPWRTIILSDKATDIVASHLIYNLNEPSKIKDASWIYPSKYVGVWWEMHLGLSTWDYEGTQVAASNIGKEKKQNKKPHGANTKRVKEYIDFAAKHGMNGVLVEGWNTGWEDWFGNWKENVFDFVTAYPDFNAKALQQYAKKKKVNLIMHHETSGSVTNYERRMDNAFQFMKKYGYDAVKTGYVGRIIPRGEHHAGQWMVNHFTRVAEKAATYRIMINSHEAVRPTGLSRTYPNWLASESARGMEFNAWSEGNKPNHETILAFTRLLGGAMDYTPGIMELELNKSNPEKSEIIHTTLAKQLALYVVIASPMQMAADLPENYEKHLDAFQFIKDVAIDWQDSKYLYAEPGDYVVVARQDKKRNWFLGAITDEEKRTFSIDLKFLDQNKKYLATIYKDGEDAHWKNNPKSYIIDQQKVTTQSTLDLVLSEGGGCAISFQLL